MEWLLAAVTCGWEAAAGPATAASSAAPSATVAAVGMGKHTSYSSIQPAAQ